MECSGSRNACVQEIRHCKYVVNTQGMLLYLLWHAPAHAVTSGAMVNFIVHGAAPKRVIISFTHCLQEAYTAYQQHFKESPASFLRDCLELSPAGEAIPLEEVESATVIMERFCTGGMSLGAISRETHETIAIAMNRIGGGLLACLLPVSLGE